MQLEKGDLLFIYRGDEPLDDAIAHVFKGYNGFLFNHVGICTGNDEVIEAIKPACRAVTFNEFVSEVDQNNPIIIARPETTMKRLAADIAKGCLGLPYNDTFLPSENSFYCSSLIHYAFKKANDNKPYFKEQVLSFTDVRTGRTMPFWIEYYRARGLEVPKGVLGSHPANLSLDARLKDVYELLIIHRE